MVKNQVIKVRGEVRWSIEETNEGLWVAVCDPLGLTVQSDTWVELMEDIGEVLEFMFADQMQEGRLDELLNQHGWTCQSQPRSETAVANDTLRFDIPFIPTLVRHDNGSQAIPA